MASTIPLMAEDNQILIPPSFIALFVEPGRTRPHAPREHIAERYEFCEDLAHLLTEQAGNKLWQLGITESDVLQRVAQGLAGDAAGVDEAEARWVLRRLAELMGWADPGEGPPAG